MSSSKELQYDLKQTVVQFCDLLMTSLYRIKDKNRRDIHLFDVCLIFLDVYDILIIDPQHTSKHIIYNRLKTPCTCLVCSLLNKQITDTNLLDKRFVLIIYEIPINQADNSRQIETSIQLTQVLILALPSHCLSLSSHPVIS